MYVCVYVCVCVCVCAQLRHEVFHVIETRHVRQFRQTTELRPPPTHTYTELESVLHGALQKHAETTRISCRILYLFNNHS